jgi:dTDP-4-dehydrorhamnose 3,5-epimerase
MSDQEKSEFIKEGKIKDLLYIERPVFHDERGYFHEIFRCSGLKSFGIDFNPIQLSHSYSLPNVIRAIHTEEWQKVIYPVTGKMFAAFVDTRPESETFSTVETFVFDNTKKDSKYTAVYLPPGIGNSICACGDEAVHYIYAVDEYWDNAKAKGIAWDDPDLNIKWPVKNPIISERDKNNPRLRELFPDKFNK